jgi:hypothetical protein
VAPTCSVSGPANLSFGGPAGVYSFTATDANYNLTDARGWWSPTTIQSWTNIFTSSFSARYSYSTSANWSCPGVGTYYVVCNAVDSGGAWCTGNPFGVPPGAESCGPTSAATVTCGASPPPQPILNPTTDSCPIGPNPQVNLSWTVGAGAYDEFHIYRCTGVCTPTTEIATTSLTSYLDTAVIDETTYSYRVRSHRHSDGVYSSYSTIQTITPDCPKCNIALSGPASIDYPSTQSYSVVNIAPYTVPDGTYDQANFTSSNPAAISICDSLTNPCPAGVGSFSDSTSGYSMNATAYTLSANSTLRVGMIMEGSERCFASINNVSVVNPPWWQVVGGDVTAGGNFLQSLIPPLTLCGGTCIRNLILDNPVGSPGIPSVAGSSAPNFNSAQASSKNWVTRNTPVLLSDPYSYQFFEDKIPSSSVPYTIGSTLSVAGMTTALSSATPFNGYYILKYDGTLTGIDFTLGSSAESFDLGNNKVILFVKGADLIIDSEVRVTDGRGGFYAISDGDINITTNVGHVASQTSSSTEDIEALLFADGQIKTLAGAASTGNDPQLHIRGSASGLGNAGAVDGVVFERDLLDNSDRPAEIFEFAPDLVLSWPPYLTKKNITWREVAP